MLIAVIMPPNRHLKQISHPYMEQLVMQPLYYNSKVGDNLKLNEANGKANESLSK